MIKTGKGKIRFALIIVCAISLSTSLFSLSYLSRMAAKVDQIGFSDARLANLGESISLDLLRARREEKNFIIYLDTTYLTSNKVILRRIEYDVKQARSIYLVEPGKLDSIDALLKQYEDRLDQLADILQEDPRALINLQQQALAYEKELKKNSRQDTGDGEIAPDWIGDINLLLYNAGAKMSSEKTQLFDEIKNITNGLAQLSEEITARARNSMVDHIREGLEYTLKAQRNTITVLIISALLLILLIIRLPSYIFLPLYRINRALEAIARGETDISIPQTDTPDEMGLLSRSFQTAFRRLQEFNLLKSEKIAENRRILQRVMEEVTEGVIILSADLLISYINDSAKALLGESDSNLAGHHLKDIPQLWGALEQTITDIKKKGRCEISLKMKKIKSAGIIPNINEAQDLESIIIVLK